LDFRRRSLLVAALLAVAIGAAKAQSTPEIIELWPASPPGGGGPRESEKTSAKGSITLVSRPRLVVHRPAHPNGTAAIVMAGGGYAHIEAGSESTPACLWLQSIGVTAFELIYRLPEDGWPPVAPFQDGQRALRIVRSRAASFGIDPGRIGLLGFSAGGHLAGMTIVRADTPLYPQIDAIDLVSARSDFAGLIYPVLSFMPPFEHTHARREIVGNHPSDKESAAYSVERQIHAPAPPIFLAQAADDPTSPVDNSLMMFNALRAIQSPAELHIFHSGGHGWGMGTKGEETSAWPDLFATWARKNGFLPAL
jgi:acetyl esterase/lipase